MSTVRQYPGQEIVYQTIPTGRGVWVCTSPLLVSRQHELVVELQLLWRASFCQGYWIFVISRQPAVYQTDHVHGIRSNSLIGRCICCPWNVNIITLVSEFQIQESYRFFSRTTGWFRRKHHTPPSINPLATSDHKVIQLSSENQSSMWVCD